MIDFASQRRRMVENQLERRGITDRRVLEAMGTVPREAFVGRDLQVDAYADGPLPIAEGQTISQPYIVALMIEALQLEGGERVLEIGGGSGYAAAVIARIAGEVYALERHRALADEASGRLRDLGFDNVEIVCADGTEGWPERAPYDAIVVAAGAPAVPEALQEQLAVGGRLVIPVGRARTVQELLRITRTAEEELLTEKLTDVRFVPLVGKAGWED